LPASDGRVLPLIGGWVAALMVSEAVGAVLDDATGVVLERV